MTFLKRSRSLRIAFAFFMLFLAGLACVPQDCMGTGYTASGHVIDEQGKPITEANVIITQSPYSSQVLTLSTGEDGAFNTDYQSAFECETITIEVSAEGYERFSEDFYLPAYIFTSADLERSLNRALTITLIRSDGE